MLILNYSDYKIGLFYPKLIPPAIKKLRLSNKQQFDSICWSTFRVIEFQQAKVPLTFDTMIFKVEDIKRYIAKRLKVV